MSRRAWLILSVLLGACAIAAFLAAPAVVRSAVQTRAELRGLDVQIDSIALRPGVVWLKDVQVKQFVDNRVNAHLNAVKVMFSLGGVNAVSAVGGDIELRGAPKEILKSLKVKSKVSGQKQSGKAALDVDFRGLFVSWQQAEQALKVWGAELQRRDGKLSLRADLVRGNYKFASAELSEVRLALNDDRSASSVSSESSLIEVNLEGLSSLSQTATTSQDNQEADSKAAPVAEQGSPTKAAQRSPLLGILRLDPSRGKRIQAKTQRLAGVLASRLPRDASFYLDGVRLRLVNGKDQISLGPARVSLKRTSSDVELAFLPGFGGGQQQHLQVELKLPLQAGETYFRIEGGPLSLADLGAKDGDFGLLNTKATRLRVRAVAEMGADAEVASFSTRGEISGIALNHPKLAPNPLTNIGFEWDGQGEVSLDGSHVRVDSAQLRLGAVTVSVNLDAKRERDRLVFSGEAQVPVASCQKMFDSLPTGLAPALAGTKLGGTFSWKASLAFDTDQLKKIKPKWRMQNDCEFLEVPPDIDPARFKHVFRRSVPDEFGADMEIWTGPGSIDWVPLPAISRYMEVALLVTEDGRFWSHKGFDQGAIESSIRQNINAGTFVRGASTITMQLSKNLYLSRDKNLARKIQEALLTMLLEQELRKDEILELYLNVIEYAPGIFGIGKAAEYYFRSVPGDLSIAQCFFLASVLPSPSAHHFEDDGHLKPGWARYLRALMRIAHGRGRLSDQELESGVAEEVQFGVPGEPQGETMPYSRPWDLGDGVDY